MSRSFPVPLYLTSAQDGNGGSSTAIRRITGTSPGTTDNTATTLSAPSTLALSRGYLVILAGQVNSQFDAGVFRNIGCRMTHAQAVASGIVPVSGDGYSIEAGNWTLPIHYSRPGGLLTADVAVTLSLNIWRIDEASGSGAVLIAEGSTAFTVGTAEASTNITVSGVATAFTSAHALFLQMHAETPAALTADTTRFHTNSTTGIRFSVIPPYTRQHARAFSDSAPVSDSIERNATYARQLSDSAPASDSLIRAATFRRALADTAPAVTDDLRRVFQANRQLADSSNVSDAITRLVSYHRQLGDSAPVTETLNRQATYARQLDDVINSGGGGESYPDGLLRLRPDGRIEAVRSGSGTLPSGALQRIISLP